MTISSADRLSVVICTKDRPAALRRCLLALLENDYRSDEVVVVDQGIPAVDQALTTAYAAHGLPLRHVLMPQSGVSRGRNLGVKESSGELIAFTDDDCVPDKGWIGALVTACTPSVDGVAGKVLPLPSANPSMVPVSSRTGDELEYFRGIALHAPWDVGTGGNLLLRRQAFEQVGGFDETLGPGTPGRASEDVDLLYRLLAGGLTLVYEPAAIVLHEMKSRTARVRGRIPYGYGRGEFLAIHARRGDRRALGLLWLVMRMQARKFVSGARHAEGWRAAEAVLTATSTLYGFGHRWFATPR